MTRYSYLIVGGGMTADAAVRGIRELEPVSSVGLIGEERDHGLVISELSPISSSLEEIFFQLTGEPGTIG